jgi:hypothetical protein
MSADRRNASLQRTGTPLSRDFMCDLKAVGSPGRFFYCACKIGSPMVRADDSPVKISQ